MRIVTFTSLFPNPEMPQRGIFVENRLRHLLDHTEVQSRVISPIPQVPLGLVRSGDHARFARVPPSAERHGIPALYPRYMHIPKIGMWLQPFAMARAALPAFQALQAGGYDFDLIDAHYFYPDGVAAALLARRLHKPLVITARGTDLNLIPRHRLPRTLIRWAGRRADGIITVCQALKDEAISLGMDGDKTTVLRNGVDLSLFQPATDRPALRQRLGITGRTLLSVGYLIPRKGHDLVIGALRHLPDDIQLVIAGDGPEKDNLMALAAQQGVSDRVSFIGAVDQRTLAEYYAASDILVLASSREGWANVLLESMACGTPVVATRVWGTPEVVTTPQAGRLVAERAAPSIATEIRALMDNYPDRGQTRAFAERFGWQPTTDGQLALFERIVRGR